MCVNEFAGASCVFGFVSVLQQAVDSKKVQKLRRGLHVSELSVSPSRMERAGDHWLPHGGEKEGDIEKSVQQGALHTHTHVRIRVHTCKHTHTHTHTHTHIRNAEAVVSPNKLITHTRTMPPNGLFAGK